MTTRNPSFTNKPPTTFKAGDTAGLVMWVQQRQTEGNQTLVWGRIQDNGINFIVEGLMLDGSHDWVRIPCRRLLDARLLLGSVMDKPTFAKLKE